MGTLTKKYRLFWNTETKKIINEYSDDYTGSITVFSDDSPNAYFESNTYEDIINKINKDNLTKQDFNLPPPIEN